jgi:hypothetical protein
MVMVIVIVGIARFHFLAKNPRFNPRHVCGVFVVESSTGTGITPSRSIFPHHHFYTVAPYSITINTYSLQFTASLNNTQKKMFWDNMNSSCVRKGFISRLNMGLLGNIQFRILGLPILY